MRDQCPTQLGLMTHKPGEIPITKQAGKGQHRDVALEVSEVESASVPNVRPPASDLTVGGRRLGQVLVAEGLISEDQLNRALAAQRTTLALLGAVLVNQGSLREDSLTYVLSAHLNAPIADLKHGEVDPEVARMLPEDFARRHLVLPLGRQILTAS